MSDHFGKVIKCKACAREFICAPSNMSISPKGVVYFTCIFCGELHDVQVQK